ncbi:MAG: pilus assembly protein PilM [Planctomycetota bacterium]
MAANIVWGLDIGDSALKVVKMAKVGNVCKIIDFDIIDIPVGDDDKDRSVRLQTALRELSNNHKFGNDPVLIAVTGNICLHRECQLPPGSEDKLRDLVWYEAKQQIPFPLDQVEWGYERFDDPSGIGVALIAVRKNDIQDILTLTDQFKLNVIGITASPLALFNYVHYEFAPRNTTLILDAGAKGTDFVVMNKRQIYFRSIQIAGREITRVLENKFKVSYSKAEELKKNITQSPQMEKILTVIEPTLRQLGAEVQRTVGFYKSKSRGQRIYQCYLLGHTFRLPKMAEYLQAQVREAPFAIVEGLQRVKLDQSCNAEVWSREFPTMAVSIGLGLQGLGLSELTLNLIPAKKQAEMEGVKLKAWAVAAAAIVVATLGLSYVQAQAVKNIYADKHTELNQAFTDVNKYENNEQKLTEMIPIRKQLLDRLSRVTRDRGKLLHVLTTLADLKNADGKQFFGEDNKVFLTNLYISRIPFPITSSADTLSDASRSAMLSKSESLFGLKSVYATLANAPDPRTLPTETRPDVPLVVILSGEVEIKNARTKISEIERALKNLNELKDQKNKDLLIESNNTPISYTQPVLLYHWEEKKLMEKSSGTVGTGKERTEEYKAFHVILHWQDTSDPDIAVESVTMAKVTVKK